MGRQRPRLIDNPGRFEFRRHDKVLFVGDTHSPNGTPMGPAGGPGWIVTAHDDYWASAFVGRFTTLPEVAAACLAFTTPARDRVGRVG